MATPLTPEEQEEFDKQVKEYEDAVAAQKKAIANEMAWINFLVRQAEENVAPAVAPFIGDFASKPVKAEIPEVPDVDYKVAKKVEKIYKDDEISFEEAEKKEAELEERAKKITTAPRTMAGDIAPVTGESFFGRLSDMQEKGAEEQTAVKKEQRSVVRKIRDKTDVVLNKNQRATLIYFAGRKLPQNERSDLESRLGIKLDDEIYQDLENIPMRRFEDLSLWEAASMMKFVPPEQRKGVAGVLTGLAPEIIRTKAEEDAWKEELKKNPNLVNTLYSWYDMVANYVDPDTGAVVENVPGWLMRLTTVPVGLLLGAAEPVVRGAGSLYQTGMEALGFEYDEQDKIQPRSFESAIAGQVGRGEGVMGALGQFGSQAAFETRGAAVSPVAAGANEIVRFVTGYPIFDDEAWRWIGGTTYGAVGLAADYALPIIPNPAKGVAGAARVGAKVAPKVAAGAKGTAAAEALTKAAEFLEAPVQKIKTQKIAKEVDALRTELPDQKVKQINTALESSDETVTITKGGVGEEVVVKKVKIKDVKYKDRTDDFYLQLADRYFPDEVGKESILQKAYFIKEIDEFAQSRTRLEGARSSIEQFYNQLARKRLDGKSGIWDIITGPRENLNRVGSVGFLPDNKMNEFNKKAKPVFDILRENLLQLGDPRQVTFIRDSFIRNIEETLSVLKREKDIANVEPDVKAAVQRFINAGYTEKNLSDLLKAFQRDYQLGTRGLFSTLVTKNETVDPNTVNTLYMVLGDLVANQFDEYQNIFNLNSRYIALKKGLKELPKTAREPSYLEENAPVIAETIDIFRRQAALVTLDESIFQPKEVSSWIGRAFKTLTPVLDRTTQQTPITKLLNTRLADTWKNSQQKLRREYFEEVSRLGSIPNARTEAFQNIFVPRDPEQNKRFIIDFVATILGRVEVIEEVLSSAGVGSARKIFNAAETAALDFIQKSKILTSMADSKNTLTLEDMIVAIQEIKKVAEDTNFDVRMKEQDLLKLLVYKKIYSSQADALLEAMDLVSNESPAQFPLGAAARMIQRYMEEINISGSVLRDPAKKALKENPRETQKLLNELGKEVSKKILKSLLTGESITLTAQEKKFFSGKAINEIRNQFRNSSQIRVLKKSMPDYDPKFVLDKIDKLFYQSNFSPLLGQILVGFDELGITTPELNAALMRSANIKGSEDLLMEIRDPAAEGMVRKIFNKIEIATPKTDNRLSRIIGDFVTNALGVDDLELGLKNTFRSITNLAKGALLTGFGLPNFRFFVANHLTGPNMVYNTLGAKYGFGALRELLFMNPRVERTLALTGTPEFFRPRAYMVDPVSKYIDTVAVNTPTRTYTYRDLRNIIENNSLTTSRIKAELTKDVIRDFVRFSRVKIWREKGIFGVKDRRTGKRILRRWLTDNQNVFADISNMSDNRYRIGVLIRALESGETEQTAVRLARESLFDYGSVSKFERDYLNNIIWFWTFRRNAYANALRNIFTNPARFKNKYLARKYFDYDREESPNTKEYAETRIGRKVFEQTEFLERYSLNGPSDPLLQTLYEFTDALAVFLMFGNENAPGFGEQLWDLTQGTALYALAQGNPIAQIPNVIADFDPNALNENKRPDTFLDVKFATYLDMIGLWDSVGEALFEKVDEPVAGRQTFNGEQWRVKSDQRAVWALIKSLLLTAGLQRLARDYAPLADYLLRRKTYGEPEIDEETGEEVFPRDVTGVQLQPNIPSFLGITTPIPEPTFEQQKARIRRQAIREIEEL